MSKVEGPNDQELVDLDEVWTKLASGDYLSNLVSTLWRRQHQDEYLFNFDKVRAVENNKDPLLHNIVKDFTLRIISRTGWMKPYADPGVQACPPILVGSAALRAYTKTTRRGEDSFNYYIKMSLPQAEKAVELLKTTIKKLLPSIAVTREENREHVNSVVFRIAPRKRGRRTMTLCIFAIQEEGPAALTPYRITSCMIFDILQVAQTLNPETGATSYTFGKDASAESAAAVKAAISSGRATVLQGIPENEQRLHSSVYRYRQRGYEFMNQLRFHFMEMSEMFMGRIFQSATLIIIPSSKGVVEAIFAEVFNKNMSGDIETQLRGEMIERFLHSHVSNNMKINREHVCALSKIVANGFGSFEVRIEISIQTPADTTAIMKSVPKVV
jgi:hypothetical protein